MPNTESDIAIRELSAATLGDVHRCDGTFTIDSRLALYAEDDALRYTVEPVTPPRQKRYPPEETDFTPYLTDPDKTAFFADYEGKLAGQIILWKYWNGYAYVEDIAVDVAFRGRGVGRALMDRAVAWARERALPGLMLETQNVNVAACRFYARYGFTLGGFDRYLYRALDPATDEVALYWYLLL